MLKVVQGGMGSIPGLKRSCTPLINSIGGAPNEDISHFILFSPLEFRSSPWWLMLPSTAWRIGVDVLRRGVGQSTLFSNLYLYESEGELR
jgi:hypothetical protein